MFWKIKSSDDFNYLFLLITRILNIRRKRLSLIEKMLRIFVPFLLILCVNLSPLHDGRRQIITRVKNYLQQYDATTRSGENPNWLENSNKIGFGYNILAASPICFTGPCQMNEFTRSIFKLNYSSSVPGSCTNKLVPNNVELDCLPSGTQSINSEIIETINHLHTSITNKVEFSVGAQLKAISFSYKYSKETQRMIDNIVKNNQISIVSFSWFLHFKEFWSKII
jgi:hypothetical protein